MKQLAKVEGVDLDRWKHIVYRMDDIIVKDKQTGLDKSISVDGNEHFTNCLDDTPKGEK